MHASKLKRSGNSFVVTVPREVVERMKLKEGQLVSVEVRPVEVRPALAPDLEAIFDDLLERHEPGLRYLAGH